MLSQIPKPLFKVIIVQTLRLLLNKNIKKLIERKDEDDFVDVNIVTLACNILMSI